MLVVWWIVTFEIPARMLFMMAAQRGVERGLPPITLWAFRITHDAVEHRWTAVLLIVFSVFFHFWLLRRWEKWDAFGKWVFKAAFIIFYVILYGLFLVIFIGVEYPVWFWPSLR